MQSWANSHRQMGEGEVPALEPPGSVDWTPDTTASQLPRAASEFYYKLTMTNCVKCFAEIKKNAYNMFFCSMLSATYLTE